MYIHGRMKSEHEIMNQNTQNKKKYRLWRSNNGLLVVYLEIHIYKLCYRNTKAKRQVYLYGKKSCYLCVLVHILHIFLFAFHLSMAVHEDKFENTLHLANSSFNHLVCMIHSIRQAHYLHDSLMASQARLENEKYYLEVYFFSRKKNKVTRSCTGDPDAAWV